MSRDLVPVEQKVVSFRGDQILTVRVAEGDPGDTVYVPLKPIIERLGLNWSGQYRRLRRDPILAEEAQGIAVTATPGGVQEMTCLPLRYLAGYLFGINANRVADEYRPAVLAYQRECYEVLYQAWRGGVLRRIMEKLLGIEEKVDDLGHRVGRIEAALGNPDRFINEEQAMQLSQAVKAVALRLGERSRRNEYGGIYGELYRRFEITSYKRLPAARFEEAMTFLEEWWRQLGGSGQVPF